MVPFEPCTAQKNRDEMEVVEMEREVDMDLCQAFETLSDPQLERISKDESLAHPFLAYASK